MSLPSRYDPPFCNPCVCVHASCMSLSFVHSLTVFALYFRTGAEKSFYTLTLKIPVTCASTLASTLALLYHVDSATGTLQGAQLWCLQTSQNATHAWPHMDGRFLCVKE